MENKIGNSYLENLRLRICPKCSQVGEMTYTGDTENYQNMGVVFRCTNEYCKEYDKKLFVPLRNFKKPSTDVLKSVLENKEERLEKALLEFIEREAEEPSAAASALPEAAQALMDLWERF